MSPDIDPRRDWVTFLPTLSTPRVTLRETMMSDAAALCRHLATEEVSKLMMQPPDAPEGFQRFIGWAHRERVAGRGFCYAVHPADSPEPVGLIQGRAMEAGYGITEWGFCIGASHWGTGIFFEASRLLADFLFRRVGVQRLEARVVVQNARAGGALRRLGADAEGVLRRGVELRGAQLDQTLWAIKSKDWLARVPEPIGEVQSGEIVDGVSDTGPPRRPRGAWTLQPPIFSTEACTLRELVIEDAQPLFDMMSNRTVADLLPPAPPNVEGFEQFIEWTQQQRQLGRSIVLGVVPPGGTHAVGFFQLHSVAPQFVTAEWGFVLDAAYWGSGLFKAGADLMLSVIFDTIGVRRLEARAAVDNPRATGALRKVGATPEAQLRRSFLVEDEEGDDMLWSLLVDEWRTRTSGGTRRATESVPPPDGGATPDAGGFQLVSNAAINAGR